MMQLSNCIDICVYACVCLCVCLCVFFPLRMYIDLQISTGSRVIQAVRKQDVHTDGLSDVQTFSQKMTESLVDAG